MSRSLGDCDWLIEVRAVRLVRLHIAGRAPIAASKRAEHRRLYERSFDLLIKAVQERDRKMELHQQRMAAWRARSAAATKAAATKRSRRARRAQAHRRV